MTQAVILCGGRGTRLVSLYSDRPKILVPIAGRPFVEWMFEWLGYQDVTDFHLAAGHKAELLAAWMEARSQGAEIRDQRSEVRDPGSDSACRLPLAAYRSPHFTLHVSRFTFHASLSTEPEPLGTGGGLRFVAPWIRSDPFLVLNGDSLVPNFDVRGLLDAHRRGGNPITIAVTRIEKTGRYGTVEFDASGRVTAFQEKAERDNGWVNAGVYVVSRSALLEIATGRAVSIETELFPSLAGRRLISAVPCPAPLLDMGTPEGIAAMEEYLCRKVPEGLT
jgi:NDP-sugar pyrophosphorylase family protein